jgi:hypothetical protein
MEIKKGEVPDVCGIEGIAGLGRMRRRGVTCNSLDF